jgi:hypothetical protein
VYVCTVVDLEFSVYDCTFYLHLYPLSDDTSGESTLTDRLRNAKALHYREHTTDDEHDEMRDVSLYQSGIPDEWTQMDQLRSAIMQTRTQRAGRRLLMQLLVAFVIVIIVGLVIAGAVS